LKFSIGISWDREFNAQVLSLATSSTVDVEQKQEPRQQTPREQDDLARTAGMLLENIKNEQNPKFQKSQFLGLMKQLRDGEVVVDGNQMVENNSQTSQQTSQVDLKGKGRATEPIVSNSGSAHALTSNFAGSAARDLAVLDEVQRQADDKQDSIEDVNDAYFRQENAEFTRYWNTLDQPTANVDTAPTAETLIWDKLQNDWDRFEATSSGIKPISKYHFQSNNPYLLGDSSRTRHHLMHAESQSVLEV
jgi:peroxin-5